MATPDVTALQQSDLNAFLFADVGTEANGMTLSVVSVFARQGSDPWREATCLAELSRVEATDKLARLIAGMPRSLWDLPAAVVIAVRLVALLPVRPAHQARVKVASGWSIGRIAVILACLALVAAYAVSTTMRSKSSASSGRVDAVSSIGAAPEKNLSEGRHP